LQLVKETCKRTGKTKGEDEMRRNVGNSAVAALGVGLAMALMTAVPATAQIHAFEKKLLAKQGMEATTQGGGESCSCVECVYLDTYDGSNPASGDLIVHTNTTLENGVPYLVTVRGTYAVWPLSWWVGGGQGAVESAPQYPSTGGQETGPVVADFEYLFGWYAPTPVLSLPMHLPFQGVSVDGGVTYNDLTPLGGQTYHSDHVYQYLVEGQGNQAYFKKHDYPTNDNYGQFRICIQKLVPCGSLPD
jgi:hypothetical protein